MNIDWVRKLTSRKLWLAVANFVSMLIIAFGYSEDKATQISAIIIAGAGVIAYIIGEGLVDSGTVFIDNTSTSEDNELPLIDVENGADLRGDDDVE